MKVAVMKKTQLAACAAESSKPETQAQTARQIPVVMPDAMPNIPEIAPMPKKYKETGICAFRTVAEAEELKKTLCDSTDDEYEIVVDNSAGLAIVKLTDDKQEQLKKRIPKRYRERCVKVFTVVSDAKHKGFLDKENGERKTIAECIASAVSYIVKHTDAERGIYFTAMWHKEHLMILQTEVVSADDRKILNGDTLYEKDNSEVRVTGFNIRHEPNASEAELSIKIKDSFGDENFIPVSKIRTAYKHTLWSSSDRLKAYANKNARAALKHLPSFVIFAVTVLVSNFVIAVMVSKFQDLAAEYKVKKAEAAAAQQAEEERQAELAQEQAEKQVSEQLQAHVHEVTVESIYKDDFHTGETAWGNYTVTLSNAKFKVVIKDNAEYTAVTEWFKGHKGKRIAVTVLDEDDADCIGKTTIKVQESGAENFVLYQPY